MNFVYIYIALFIPTASAYHLENLLNHYLGCGECKLLKSKIQVFLHQAFFKRKAVIISRLCGSLCLNSYVPNTFILGDSPVRVKTLRKSVTSSYKVNKEFRFKVFCTVFILCVYACMCVCCLVFPLRKVRGKAIHVCAFGFSLHSVLPYILCIYVSHMNTSA